MMWSEEAEAFMRENYPHHSAEWMSDAIEQRFGERLNPTAIRQKAYRMGIKVTKKRLSDASKEHRTAEIGRMNTWSKGYKFIRTEDGWVSYGKYLLEQATHEEIPKDYAIVFKDGDMENYSVDNLIAVPKGWQSTIALNGWAGQMLEVCLMWLRLHDLCNGCDRRIIRHR